MGAKMSVPSSSSTIRAGWSQPPRRVQRDNPRIQGLIPNIALYRRPTAGAAPPPSALLHLVQFSIRTQRLVQIAPVSRLVQPLADDHIPIASSLPEPDASIQSAFRHKPTGSYAEGAYPTRPCPLLLKTLSQAVLPLHARAAPLQIPPSSTVFCWIGHHGSCPATDRS